MGRTAFSVVDGSGKVSAPTGSTYRREAFTDPAVADPATLAQQLARQQNATEEATAPGRGGPFSNGARLMRDIHVSASVVFTVRHNLNRKVYVLVARFDGGVGCSVGVVSEDANSVTLRPSATGTLALLVF